MNLPDEDSLPQDARGADRPADGAARRPRGRAARLRRRHDGRLRTTCSGVAEITHPMVHEYGDGHLDGHRARGRPTPTCVSDLTRRIRDEEQQELAFEAATAARRIDLRRTAASSTSSRAGCSSTRCSSAPRSTTSCAACRAWSDAPASRACGWSPARGASRRRPPPDADAPGRAGTGRRVDSAPACSPGSTTSASPSRTSTPRSRSTSASYEMRLVHREVVEEQGVEAVLLDVGENHVELLRAARPRTRRSASSSPSTGPGSTTSPTRSPTSRPSWSASPAAGLRLIDETPRIGIRGSRVAFLHPASSGRRADRDRPTRGGPLMHRRSASASASTPARRSPCASPTTRSSTLAGRARQRRAGTSSTTEDGTVTLNLAQVVCVKVDAGRAARRLRAEHLARLVRRRLARAPDLSSP